MRGVGGLRRERRETASFVLAAEDARCVMAHWVPRWMSDLSVGEGHSVTAVSLTRMRQCELAADFVRVSQSQASQDIHLE